MIVYKWVIKQNNRFYSLMNYGINSWRLPISLAPYCINNIYSDYQNYGERLTNPFEKKGFHFWKNPEGEFLGMKLKWNNYLQKRNQPKINAILLCEININDIIKENDIRVIAKKFKVIEQYE